MHGFFIHAFNLVFAPKFRRKIIYGQLRQDIANIRAFDS